MKTKSKKELTAQIQRIYKHYKDHRLYNLAQALVLRYNYNMSMTETNRRLHREYMACHTPTGATWPGKEQRADELLELMGSTQYPQSVYAKDPKKEKSFDLLG